MEFAQTHFLRLYQHIVHCLQYLRLKAGLLENHTTSTSTTLDIECIGTNVIYTGTRLQTDALCSISVLLKFEAHYHAETMLEFDKGLDWSKRNTKYLFRHSKHR